VFQRAIRGHGLPKYLSSDHDPLYRFHQWQANLRILEVNEIKTVPHVPISHPFVERLIGTIRREYLDRLLFWTTADLEAKLIDFQNYYNFHRTHTGLGGRTPARTHGRRIWITDRCRLVSVAEPLSRVVPNSNRRVILNSPCTGPGGCSRRGVAQVLMDPEIPLGGAHAMRKLCVNASAIGPAHLQQPCMDARFHRPASFLKCVNSPCSVSLSETNAEIGTLNER
jgi:hypothetical protein